MKNFPKLFGIIALAAVIGFSVIACDNGMASGGINGDWSNGATAVRINGSTGTIREFQNINALWQNAVSKGYIRTGSEYFRNLSQTGNMTWEGQRMNVTYNSSSPNVATGTAWRSCTISLNANGRTFDLYSSDSSGSTHQTFTRR